MERTLNRYVNYLQYPAVKMTSWRRLIANNGIASRWTIHMSKDLFENHNGNFFLKHQLKKNCTVSLKKVIYKYETIVTYWFRRNFRVGMPSKTADGTGQIIFGF